MESKREEGSEAKPKHEFGTSGPVYLNSVDWRKPNHTRTVLASLVQGVYILERDRQQKRTGNKALSPLWWSFFHFECIDTLVDRIDRSIFGAIFEYKPRAPSHHQGAPPRYIIVFRGTIIEPDTRKRDLYLDFQLSLNGLAQDSRYQIAFQEIHAMVINMGPKNVLLVGHSLGASIALQAGKEMAKMGFFVECYLFNLPYTSSPIEKITDPHFKGKRYITKSIVTAGFNLFRKSSGDDNMTQSQNTFNLLCSWIPKLFVNPRDPICREYIGHFEHRGRMQESRLEKADQVSTKSSLMSKLSGSFGREDDPPNLIPSALLTKNMIAKEQSFKEAHGLEQWWKPHSHWQSKLYVYGQN